MKYPLAVVAFTLLSTEAFAFPPNTWTSGWAQGVTEYAAVDRQGNNLLISCPDEQGESGVSVTFSTADRTYDNFVLVVDGETLDGFQDASSRAGADNFKYAYEKLRRAKSIEVRLQNQRRFTLPTRNAQKILPATNASNFVCKTGW